MIYTHGNVKDEELRILCMRERESDRKWHNKGHVIKNWPINVQG